MDMILKEQNFSNSDRFNPEDIIKMKRRLNDIYVRHTGQNYETIEKTLDRDYFLSAEDACAFGIVDEVLTKRHALDEKLQRLAPVS